MRLRFAAREITTHCPWNYVSSEVMFSRFFPKIFVWKIWSCRNYFVTLQYQNIPAKLKESWAQVRRRSNYTISYKIHPSSQLLPKKKMNSLWKRPTLFADLMRRRVKKKNEDGKKRNETWKIVNSQWRNGKLFVPLHPFFALYAHTHHTQIELW